MLREATYPPAAVNVLDVSSESMAAFQVFMYGCFCVFTEADLLFWSRRLIQLTIASLPVIFRQSLHSKGSS